MARMELSRWDPFRDLMSLQNDLNRLFGRSSSEVFTGQWAPSLDVYETGDNFTLKVDLPGMTSEDIEVTLDKNMLTIRGERKFSDEVDEDSYHRIERRYGSFQRTISLPAQVDADGIQASFTDGVLEITVPKAEQAKPRTIKVGEGARHLNA